MKLLIVLLILTLSPFCSWSQQAKIKGQLKDTDSQQLLAHGTAILFFIKDSSLKASALTDKNGFFELSKLTQGEYILHVSYIGYKPVTLTMIISTKDTTINLGVIPMSKNKLTLTEVEIMGKRIPVIVKKDTLEFNAEFFKTRENAVIEELLNKLPGVQIDRDGTIRVQGEVVKKVLVEGKFFFEDPKTASRNLPAEMIDKVQVINRKSDQERLTGVDDGKREKTINITLKKKWKQELFGQLTAGYGTDERFSASGNLNRISDRRQVSLLSNSDNINGYGSQGGILPNNTNGIIRSWNTGINYSEYIGKKLKLSGNYMLEDTRNENQRISAQQNFLRDTTFYYNQESTSRNNATAHNLNIKLEYSIDSMHTLNSNTYGNYNMIRNLQENFYESLGNKQHQVNQGTSGNTTKNNTFNIYNGTTFTKKFRKARQSLSISINFALNGSNQNGLLRSNNIFLQPSGEMDTMNIDQRNILNNEGYMLQGGLNYSKPLFKDHTLLFAYLYTYSYASSDKFTYNYNPARKIYDRLNDSLTNSFNSILSFHYTSLNVQTQKAKYNYTIGLTALMGTMDNKNISLKEKLRIHTTILYPVASFNYTFTNSKQLRFNYAASIHQPSVGDLQPVPDNSNPLYIRKGNPDLKTGRTDNFNLSYNIFNTTTMRSLMASINVGFTSNKIVQATWFDTLGRQVSQPLNLHGSYAINANAEQSIPIKKQQSSIKTNTIIGFNRDINYINGIRGNISNYNMNQTISLNYRHRELIDVMATAVINYNNIQYSVQKESNTKYFNYAFSLNSNINLPLGFIIGNSVDYILNTGRAAGYNLDFTMLNAFISKSIFKHKQGVIKLQGFDLLKQNVSVVRTVGQSYIEDVQTTALQRFFMLSFSYHLKPKQ
jgi:hypothetical protein